MLYSIGSLRIIDMRVGVTIDCDDCEDDTRFTFLVVGSDARVRYLCLPCTLEVAYLTGTNDEQRVQAHVSYMIGAHV